MPVWNATSSRKAKTADGGPRTAVWRSRAAVRGLWSAVAAVLLLLSACDATGPEAGEFEPRYVLESYQVAGRRLAPVRLTRTAPLDATYDLKDVAVHGARVRVELLGPGGDVEETYAYTEVQDELGLYRPLLDVRVQPLHTYRVVAMIPQGLGDTTRLRATTTVPGPISILQTLGDTVTYRTSQPLTLTVTKSHALGRAQGYYILLVQTLLEEPTSSDLTSFSRSLIEESRGALELADFFSATSPILNEAGFTETTDSTFTLEVPWLLISFYGSNLLVISALDDNLYDFIRSQSVQQGGSTLAPGEIPNVIEHVEGGTGVFGSLARQNHFFFMRRPEDGANLYSLPQTRPYDGFSCNVSVLCPLQKSGPDSVTNHFSRGTLK